MRAIPVLFVITIMPLLIAFVAWEMGVMFLALHWLKAVAP